MLLLPVARPGPSILSPPSLRSPPLQVFVGNHAKQVAVWVPPAAELDSNVVLDEHCGWVRSLAVAQGRWLFSCACNTLRQWDMSRAVPRCVSTVCLDKGDILALVARKDRIYAANADGSIRCAGGAPRWPGGVGGGASSARAACRVAGASRPMRRRPALLLPVAPRPCAHALPHLPPPPPPRSAWSIDRKSGDLSEVACHMKAHGERVTAIALRGALLYSVSYDGCLKAWDADNLDIVVDRWAAPHSAACPT